MPDENRGKLSRERMRDDRFTRDELAGRTHRDGSALQHSLSQCSLHENYLVPGVRKCVALEERDWLRVVGLNLGGVPRSAVVLPCIFRLSVHLCGALQEGIWLVCGGIAVGLFLRVGLFQIIGLVVLHDRLVAGCRGGFARLGGKEGKGRLVRLKGSQS